MNIELTDEFENKIKKLMKELNIIGQWDLIAKNEDLWEFGNPIPHELISYELRIVIEIPDKYIKIT